MKRVNLLLLVLAISMTACKNDKKDNEVKEPLVEKETEVSQKDVTIQLNSKSDSNVTGKVAFIEENGSVKMTATISGLEPGAHAIHIHESSDCSSDDGKSAGGHWNPTSQPHGAWGNESGYHKGDIGNFTADEDGNGTVFFSTEEWCIGCDDENKNILGKSVIVHAGADDLTSQPSGDAGARVSCAGIIQ